MYDREFKLAAVRWVVERNLDLHQVAADFGICASLLERWLRQYAVNGEDARKRWRLKSRAEEKQELHRDIQLLKEEREQLRRVMSSSLFPDRLHQGNRELPEQGSNHESEADAA